ncbi:hypothetical protein HYPSUDRAFT_1049981 [Hypholoma sublateritium FD-334 SS-4]|uniref:Uncharacterized protein n=1 Tax=Hypholoma sublateritium (strain FD-334 SS-4) TaxID=945553 RepID=A0A0D2M0Y6_HYPSF|nr:hypothetical protein HYPSUDRAFT_1049981 [Hypholoma sublateritium FD-334 SS-4]
MVRATSAVAFAVVAMNVASGLAMSYDYDADLMERDFGDFELDARDYMTEIEARELLADITNLDARDYEEFDALRSRPSPRPTPITPRPPPARTMS